MILGFLLSAITFPVSIVLMESCEVLDAALGQSTYMRTALGSFSVDSDAIDIIDTCFFQDGELLTQLGIKEQLTKFDTIFDELKKAENGNVYSETDPLTSSFVIPIQQDYVGGVKEGKYVDSQETVTDLAKLNGLTNSGGCAALKDIWVIHSMNCTIPNKLDKPGDADNKDVGIEICIGFDEWTSATAINNRYTTQFASCAAGTDTTAKALVDEFISHRTDIDDLFGKLLNGPNGLAQVEIANNDFMTKVSDMNTNFRNVNTDLQSVQSAFTDPTTGIVNNANCKFLKVSLARLKDTMCVSFVSSLYQTAICILIVSFFSFFGAFFVFCLAKRLNVKDKKDDDEEEQHAKNDK